MRFVRCDLSNARAQGVYLNRCAFESCKLLGADLRRCVVKECSFQDVVMPYANLDEGNLQIVRMEDCDLANASLAALKHKDWTLERCKLADTSFFRTPLKGQDLRSCQIQSLSVSDNFHELRGALVTPEQAVVLSRLLGLDVRD